MAEERWFDVELFVAGLEQARDALSSVDGLVVEGGADEVRAHGGGGHVLARLGEAARCRVTLDMHAGSALLDALGAHLPEPVLALARAAGSIELAFGGPRPERASPAAKPAEPTPAAVAEAAEVAAEAGARDAAHEPTSEVAAEEVPDASEAQRAAEGEASSEAASETASAREGEASSEAASDAPSAGDAEASSETASDAPSAGDVEASAGEAEAQKSEGASDDGAAAAEAGGASPEAAAATEGGEAPSRGEEGEEGEEAEAAPAAGEVAEPAPAVEVAPPSPPEIVSIEPGRGPTVGGTAVTITGAHFADDVVVELGGRVLPVLRESAERLVVTTRARDEGLVDVIVSVGDLRALRPNGFEFVGPPIVTEARPSVVSARAPTRVVLRGTGFAEGLVVRVAEHACEVEREPDGALLVTVPPGPAGVLDVVVETPDGQQGRADALLERREGPVVEQVLPQVSPLAGGILLSVRGRGFEEGATVTLLGDVAVPQVEVVSAHELRFPVPPRTEAGTGGVRVSLPSGLSFELEGAFSYEAPRPLRVDAVSPALGYVIGGTRLTLEGDGFGAAVVVFVGDAQADVLDVSPTRLVCSTPPAAAPGPAVIRVEHEGFVAEVEGRFSYDLPPAPPKVVSLTPAKGWSHGGEAVRVLGDNFDEATRIRFRGPAGDVDVEAKVAARNALDLVTPKWPEAGQVDVVALGRDGVEVVFREVFRFEVRPPPEIHSVSPGAGSVLGGARVTLEGTLFPTDAWVRIGRERPTQIPTRTPTQIVFVAPPRREAGFVDVELGVGEVVLATKKNAFKYEGIPAPVLTSVAPNRGGTAGGTELTLEGNNFVKESVVLIGGKPAAKVKLVDAKTLEVKTPPGTDGAMVDVVVKNPDGKEAVSKRAFQYDARYR